jgi:hypothetical protein
MEGTLIREWSKKWQDGPSFYTVFFWLFSAPFMIYSIYKWTMAGSPKTIENKKEDQIIDVDIKK